MGKVGDAPKALQGLLPRTVTARGEGWVEVQPDAARISVGILVARTNVKKARAEAARQAEAIIAAVKQAGIAARDIQTSGYSVYPQRNIKVKGKPATIVSYDVRNTISVTVRELERLPELLDAATLSGANLISGPDFFIQSPEAHEDEARRLAIASARRRAEVLATAVGAALGQVYSIDDGQSRGLAPRGGSRAYRMLREGLATPVESGTEQIIATVEVVWELM